MSRFNAISHEASANVHSCETRVLIIIGVKRFPVTVEGRCFVCNRKLILSATYASFSLEPIASVYRQCGRELMSILLNCCYF
jgi:hypothetical protein